MRIPYATAEHALTALRALSVDRELNASHVYRQVVADESVLHVYGHVRYGVQAVADTCTYLRQYAAATVRLLRLATNGFLDNCKLVTRTLQEFAPK